MTLSHFFTYSRINNLTRGIFYLVISNSLATHTSFQMDKLPEASHERWDIQFYDRIKLPDLAQYNFNILEFHTQNVSCYVVLFCFEYFCFKILRMCKKKKLSILNFFR